MTANCVFRLEHDVQFYLKGVLFFKRIFVLKFLIILNIQQVFIRANKLKN